MFLDGVVQNISDVIILYVRQTYCSDERSLYTPRTTQGRNKSNNLLWTTIRQHSVQVLRANIALHDNRMQ